MSAGDELVLTREKMERWFAARGRHALLFGIEQDEDVIMAEPENVPLLCEFLDRRGARMERRTAIVLAMSHLLMPRTSAGSEEAAQALEAALLRNRDAVEASYRIVGEDAHLMLAHLLGGPTLAYEQGEGATVLVADPTPDRGSWAAYVTGAFAELESRGVEFPAGRTHFRGLLGPDGIAARYRERAFRLRCDSPGTLTVEHGELRPSQIPGILYALHCTYGLGRW